jgi:crotonobetainyl-CoA:carnitine CoA-transferase CaiB-like acyl-CoA transferase
VPSRTADPPRAGSGDALLEGFTVLDATRSLPGAYCTMTLADVGADVIKVEHPREGDLARWSGARIGSQSIAFHAFNRNKRSVSADLKTERGRAVVHALARGADAFVEGFRPGVAGRLGVSSEALHEINPGLVYCSITGYGQEGPLRDRPGHDLNYQARAGALGLCLDEDGEPFLPRIPLADHAAGLMAAFAITAALHRRRRTGEGAYIDLAMTDVVMQWVSEFSIGARAAGTEPDADSFHWTGGSAGYNVYRTRDGGHMALGAEEHKFWRRFTELAGRPDLAARDPLATGADGAALKAELAALFAQRTRAEWEALFSGQDVPCDPVLGPGEALTSDQARARDMVASTTTVDGAALEMPGLPFRYGGAPWGIRGAPPALGQHDEELLGQHDRSIEEQPPDGRESGGG